ncbi:MAG TPA: C4-type zinc ribbon domain-containing protein [Chthonomonadales bacterium]|nr:C4-type zinc ribbon domain-containing protein [Chthonomonadales bacterium]
MKEKLAALYALQQLDSALDLLKRQYAALDAGRAEEAALKQQTNRFQESADSLNATTAALHDAELELKTVETKRAEEEKKLYGGTVRAAKELQSIQDEIQMLGRQRGKLDEHILELMEKLESSRQAEAAARREKEIAETALEKKRAEHKRDSEAIAAKARTLAAERKQAAALVAADLMKRYESLKPARNGLAIVALVDGNACGGCKLAIPASVVARVQDGRTVELCQNCGRILFDAEGAK